MSVNELPIEALDINDIVPIGSTIEWYSLILPSDKFVFVIGQEFDKVTYDKLAVFFPSGVLPDPRYDFIRYTGIENVAGTKVEQSVQPLTFVGDALPNHQHTLNTPTYWAYGGSGGIAFTSGSKRGNVSQYIANGISAGTPTGTIGGTGKETAPRHMLVYPIMRIK